MSWPPNDALRFDVGCSYRVHLKTGGVIEGRCAMRSVGTVLLVSPAGHFNVRTGAILRYDNL